MMMIAEQRQFSSRVEVCRLQPQFKPGLKRKNPINGLRPSPNPQQHSENGVLISCAFCFAFSSGLLGCQQKLWKPNINNPTAARSQGAEGGHGVVIRALHPKIKHALTRVTFLVTYGGQSLLLTRCTTTANRISWCTAVNPSMLKSGQLSDAHAQGQSCVSATSPSSADPTPVIPRSTSPPSPRRASGEEIYVWRIIRTNKQNKKAGRRCTPLLFEQEKMSTQRSSTAVHSS